MFINKLNIKSKNNLVFVVGSTSKAEWINKFFDSNIVIFSWMTFEGDAIGFEVSPFTVVKEITVIIINTMVVAILIFQISIESVQTGQLNIIYRGNHIRVEKLTIRLPIS